MYIFVLCRNEEQSKVAAIPAVGCRNCIVVPGSWPQCPQNGSGGFPPPEDGHSEQPQREPWSHPIRDTAIHTISMRDNENTCCHNNSTEISFLFYSKDQTGKAANNDIPSKIYVPPQNTYIYIHSMNKLSPVHLLTLVWAPIWAPLFRRRATNPLWPSQADTMRGVAQPYPRQREIIETFIKGNHHHTTPHHTQTYPKLAPYSVKSSWTFLKNTAD